MPRLREIILLLVSAVLPVLYELIVSSHPDFPLSQSQFASTAIWLLSGIIGGQAVSRLQIKKRHDNIRAVLNRDSAFDDIAVPTAVLGAIAIAWMMLVKFVTAL